MEDLPHKGFGFLDTKVYDPRDYIFGGISSAPTDFIRENADWTDSLPVREVQVGRFLGSSQDCVTRSFLNCLEIYAKARYNKDTNWNDRYLAVRSGTTIAGNSFDVVAETARKIGLVEQSAWDIDMEKVTWEDYYAPIPAEIDAKAYEFHKEWVISHEWVYDWKEALKYGPLQISWVYKGSYTANNNGIINPYDNHPTQDSHASVLVGYKEGEYKIVYDSFDNVVKRLSWDYPIRNYKRVLITAKVPKPMPMIEIKNNFLVRNIATGEFGLHIDGKIYLDDYAALLLTYIDRNSGDIKDKRLGLTAEQWQSFPKYNLKNQPL